MLPWVTKEAGPYHLSVRSPDQRAKAGRYEVRVDELRPAAAQDEGRSAGERALIEGNRLSTKQTAETSRQALKFFEEAVKSFRDAGDRKREAQALYNLAETQQSLSGLREGLELFNQSLPLWREVSDRAGEAKTIVGIASMYFYLGDYRTSLEYSERALPIWRELGSVMEEAATLTDIGVAYRSLSDYQQALDHYDQALLLIRSSEPKAQQSRLTEANVLTSICVACTRLGELQRALDSYQQSLSLYRQAGSRTNEAILLNRTALVLYSLGESEKSLEYNHESLRLLRITGDRRQEAITLNDLGLTHNGLGNFSKAVDYYQQSLQLAKEVNHQGGQVITLHNLGVSSSLMGDKEKALSCFTQALAIARALGDREAEAKTLISLGRLYQLFGDNKQATDSLERALPLCRAIKVRPHEALALVYLAQANRELGNLPQALAQGEGALNITESLRSRVTSPERRSSFFASVLDRYDSHIETLMQIHQQRPSEGRAAMALQVSERARARSLLELLAEARADIRQGVDPALLQKERGLQQRLNAKAAAQTRLFSGKYTEAQATTITKEVADLTAQLKEVETQIRISSPRYAALTQPHPVTVAEIQQQVLDSDTLLLEYTLGERRSYLWAVTPSSVTSYLLPPRAEIEATARKVYDLLTARQPKTGLTEAEQRARVAAAETEYARQAAALSRVLLGPVADQLGNKRLLIVAPGALQYLPFAAFPKPQPATDGGQPTTGGRPLIVDHEVVSLPASVLAVLRREVKGRQLASNGVAVLADPVFELNDPRVKASGQNLSTSAGGKQPPPTGILPSNLERAIRSVRPDAPGPLSRLYFTREEAEAILAVPPAATNLKALDFRANRATVVSDQLSLYQIVHFATHGLINSEHPELSGLVLSLVDEAGHPQDGFLRLHEIYNLRLTADLVVLSACQTALGKEVRGEGLIGLTRGFMYAGAPRVIASLWQVDDVATSELMKRLYRGMLKEGLQPAAALRTAQVEMWRQKRWVSPYYWGAFVLQGEWK